jgi:hypothetical protein
LAELLQKPLDFLLSLQILVCLFQPTCLLSGLLVKLSIVDRHGCLTCQRGEKLNLFFGKFVLLFCIKAKDPYGFAFSNQRNP